jgi:hypothetical protein
MAYVTPVTDRTSADIAARNSKAFMNVVDWTRIYNNSQLVNSLAAIMLGTGITFDVIALPTITTIPSVTNLNLLTGNIERIRVAVAAVLPSLTEIKDDYIAGAGEVAPRYTDVNLWESTLDAVWVYYDGPDLDVCPTLSADLTVATGTNHIVVDCIDAANFNIDIQGTGNLYII